MSLIAEAAPSTPISLHMRHWKHHMQRAMTTRSNDDGANNTTATPIPIAAIAGGVAGGAALVVIVVCLWKWWGSRLEKEDRKNRAEKHAAQQRHGRNASGQSQRSIGAPPRPSMQSSRSTAKVGRLSGEEDSRGIALGPLKASHGPPPGLEHAQPLPVHVPSASRSTARQPTLNSPVLLPSQQILTSSPPPTINEPPSRRSPFNSSPPKKAYAPARPSPLAQSQTTRAPSAQILDDASLAPPAESYPYLPSLASDDGQRSRLSVASVAYGVAM